MLRRSSGATHSGEVLIRQSKTPGQNTGERVGEGATCILLKKKKKKNPLEPTSAKAGANIFNAQKGNSKYLGQQFAVCVCMHGSTYTHMCTETYMCEELRGQLQVLFLRSHLLFKDYMYARTFNCMCKSEASLLELVFFPPAMWVLGSELRYSDLATSVFAH